MKSLRDLLGLCTHKWEIHREFKITLSRFDLTIADEFIRYHLKCEKCGDVKCRDMK